MCQYPRVFFFFLTYIKHYAVTNTILGHCASDDGSSTSPSFSPWTSKRICLSVTTSTGKFCILYSRMYYTQCVGSCLSLLEWHSMWYCLWCTLQSWSPHQHVESSCKYSFWLTFCERKHFTLYWLRTVNTSASTQLVVTAQRVMFCLKIHVPIFRQLSFKNNCILSCITVHNAEI